MLVNIPIIKSTRSRDWQVLLQMQTMLFVHVNTHSHTRASAFAALLVIKSEGLVMLGGLC